MWVSTKALKNSMAHVLKSAASLSLLLLLTACGGGEQRTPFLWQNTLGNSSFTTTAAPLTDTAGNSYRGFVRAGQGWLRKMDTNGNTVWETPVNDVPVNTDFVIDMQLFSTSNGITVAMGIPALNNVTIKRSDANGNTLWKTTLSDFQGSLVNPDYLTLDAQDNLYLVESRETTGITHNTLIKVNAQGAQEWRKSLPDCSLCFESLTIVAGQIVYLMKLEDHLSLVALDAAGNPRWENTYAIESPWYQLIPAGNMMIMWSYDTLHTISQNGTLIGNQHLDIAGAPLWNGDNTLFVPTTTQLLAMDRFTNVLHSMNFPVSSASATIFPIRSHIVWQPERRQLAFIQLRSAYKTALQSDRYSILVYDETLALKSTFYGASHDVATCGFPGCYIPKAYGDLWYSLAFAGNNTLLVNGARQGEGNYTGAYRLP